MPPARSRLEHIRGRPGPEIILVLGAVLGVALCVCVGTPIPAEAAVGPSADLSVTSPPDPILTTPGAVATATLTVGNVGHSPLDVRITPESVKLLDNGHTQLVAGADPRFAGRISISPDQL